MQIVIWGAGRKFETVMACLKPDVQVLCIVDNSAEKIGTKYKDTLEIKNPRELSQLVFDAIVVSVMNDASIEAELVSAGLRNKTVFFWRDEASPLVPYIFRNRIRTAYEEADLYRARLDSAPYEWGIKPVPQILSGEDLLKKMIKDRSSLCRFGDGEFEIMLNRDRAWFQKNDGELGRRLREIIVSPSNHINIAIAQDFLLDKYSEDAADGIRIYMYGERRDEIIQMLSDDCTYYDAYISRPYLMYRNRENSDRLFPLFKQLWKGKKVCMIEGSKGRFGIGNDLLKNTTEIIRIACPAANAWNQYGNILSYVTESVSKEYLILISLGPAATVLAYDLAMAGYQVVDIGQLDNEYDWYLRGATERIPIPGKMVAEFNFSTEEVQKNEAIDKVYRKQLLKVIDGTET